jgi:sulfite reductase (NADPH) flavoprotein alpha-component
MKTLPIYYATVTGNAETLARQAETRAQREGWLPRLENLSEVKPADLTSDSLALFIVSTWGDGEPPADATDFWYDLAKASLDLSGLRYAVLGLGDKDYQDFNAFARQLDERLAALGARRLHERIEADLAFDDTYAEWADRVFPLLAEVSAAAASH